MQREEVIRKISEMEYEDLMEVLSVATKRWGEMFPDWEIVTFSAPRNDPQAKKDAIQYALAMLEQEKEENTAFLDVNDLHERER